MIVRIYAAIFVAMAVGAAVFRSTGNDDAAELLTIADVTGVIGFLLGRLAYAKSHPKNQNRK